MEPVRQRISTRPNGTIYQKLPCTRCKEVSGNLTFTRDAQPTQLISVGQTLRHQPQQQQRHWRTCLGACGNFFHIPGMWKKKENQSRKEKKKTKKTEKEKAKGTRCRAAASMPSENQVNSLNIPLTSLQDRGMLDKTQDAITMKRTRLRTCLPENRDHRLRVPPRFWCIGYHLGVALLSAHVPRKLSARLGRLPRYRYVSELCTASPRLQAQLNWVEPRPNSSLCEDGFFCWFHGGII